MTLNNTTMSCELFRKPFSSLEIEEALKVYGFSQADVNFCFDIVKSIIPWTMELPSGHTQFNILHGMEPVPYKLGIREVGDQEFKDKANLECVTELVDALNRLRLCKPQIFVIKDVGSAIEALDHLALNLN